jgi:hypothetical protein
MNERVRSRTALVTIVSFSSDVVSRNNAGCSPWRSDAAIGRTYSCNG